MPYHDLNSCEDYFFTACKSLTYPSHQDILKAGLAGHTQVAGVVATEVSENVEIPTGLILCTISEDGRSSEILSVSVSKPFRNQKIATTLFTHLEETLRARGVQEISAVYTTSMTSHPILEKMLRKQDWPDPEPRNFFCRGDVRHVHDNASWMKRIKCPSRFELFSWKDLSSKERGIIKEDIKKDIVPADLSPFQEEETIEPYTSVGIRMQGRVVGWQTNHPVQSEPGVLRYSYTFAYPEFQRTGRAFILIKEAIQRNMKFRIEQFPRFVSSVAYRREPMLRFYERHLTPVSEKSYSSYGVSKKLS
jgi:GNAT superfamily N-acetyltransferase